MQFRKLGMLILMSVMLTLYSCGKEEETKLEPCTSSNCDNPQTPALNLIGTWRVFDGQEEFDDNDTVTFNADGTGVADEDNNFALFNGNNGELITEFTWEYKDSEEWYLVDFGFFGRFYSILEIDCDYMRLENNSTITSSGEKLKLILCREN